MFGKKKKYLEYYFNDEELNSPEIAKGIIGEFISPAVPRTSCWWSNLKSNIDNFKTQFDYIKNEHNNTFSIPDGNFNTQIPSSRSTAKQCPAIHSIFGKSFLVKCPSDIIITVDRHGGFLYNSSSEHIVVSTHSTIQFHSEKDNIFVDKMNLKFELPISIRTDNIPWIYMQPMYHNNMWFDVAVGVIEGKYTKGQPLNVNVLLDIPKGDPVTYEIKSGDVLAYIWFPERVELRQTQTPFIRKLFKRKWSTRSMFN